MGGMNLERKMAFCLALLLALSGCGRREQEEAVSGQAAGDYWTVAVGEQTVSLRSGGEDRLDLMLEQDGVETLLRTLRRDTDYHTPQDLSAWAFTDIMDYEGFALRTGILGGYFGTNVYYALEGGAAVPIAESFGYSAEDYAVDLDGDGVTELVVNNTYGGDGHRMTSVFQRREDEVWIGVITLPELPGHDNWGVNSYWTEYDPEKALFRITYSVKGQEAPGVLESGGLEWFDFAPYVYEKENREGGGTNGESD